MPKRLTEFEAEDRIIKSLRRRDGEATAGDVAADTGLPLEEVEQVLRQMLQYYKSHLDVDDDGNLLYRFDPKFKHRGHQRGRWWHQFKKKSWQILTLGFKGWIMVMLVGYTLAFIALLLAFAIAGVAAAASSDSDAGGEMMLLPFYLILRILELVFWFSLFDSMNRRMEQPRRHRMHGHGRYGRGMNGRGMHGRGSMYGGGMYGHGRRRSGGGLMGRLQKKKKEKPEEPLYAKIFRYVFGPEEEVDELAAEKAFARFVRANNGRVTAADWASRTGSSLEAAERALTASAVRFRGDIDVSEDGVLVYRFDDLRVTTETGVEDERGAPAPIWRRPARLPKLTGKNTKKANRWITTLNGFNLMMGAIVLASVTAATSAAAIGLGWIPLVFSALFFAIPGMRAIRRRFKKRKVARVNERRKLVEAVYLSVDEDGQTRPVDAKIFDTSKAGEEIVRDFEADVEVSDDGDIYYTFPRVAEELEAAKEARHRATAELVFGKTIFSSDEEELSLDDAEMAEFDRRLARELGGDITLDFDMEWEEYAEDSQSVTA